MCWSRGMTSETGSTTQGKRFTYRDVPIELRPLQQPHPPFWYESSTPDRRRLLPASAAINYVTLGPLVRSRRRTSKAYKTAYARRGDSGGIRACIFRAAPQSAFNRHVVVADTDADAVRIAPHLRTRCCMQVSPSYGGRTMRRHR